MLQTPTIAFLQTADAEFRAWGLAISTAIQAMGIVKTSDTGQVNWGIVAKPAAVSTSQGYEIYRFADTLQGTAPVFFKLEYGSASGGATIPAQWITVGTGSDGAGNLTGTVSPRYSLPWSVAGNGSPSPSIFSGSTNRILACLKGNTDAAASSSQFSMFSIERSHDSSGNDTGVGVHLFASAPAGGVNYVADWTNSYIAPAKTNLPTITHDGTTWQGGANVGIAPVMAVGMGLWNPSISMAGYFNTDIAIGNVISLSPYGTAHSYWALGGWPSGLHTNTNLRLLVRYD